MNAGVTTLIVDGRRIAPGEKFTMEKPPRSWIRAGAVRRA